jgi:hypothetical protein
MQEYLTKAQDALNDANYSRCFEWLEKATMIDEQKTQFNRFKQEFISGGQWDFYIRLGEFIRQLKNN